MGSGQRHRLDLCPIHYVATQRRGASRRKRGGPHPRGDRSRRLHLPLPATVFTVQRADVCWPPTTHATARRYINDRRTADADKPRSGPLRESFPCNGCFRFGFSNRKSMGWRGIKGGGAVSKRGGFFLSRDIAFLFSFVFLMGGCNEICRSWIRVNRRFVKVRTMREECILI